MKAGATYSLMLKVPDIIDSTINIIDGIDKIIFTLESSSGSRIQKIYPDSVTLSKDTFILPLSQEDTSSLVGRVKLEAQVNYANSSVQKSYIKTFLINETLATEIVEGNQPDTTHNLELLLDIIGSDSLLVNIDPELSAQLIAEIRKIYTNMQDLSLDINEYVQLSKGQISQQTSSAMQDISKLTIAKLSDINDTAQAQVDTLNRTAQAQIEAINEVAKKNIETETNSIIQAAQNQIAGINKVASGQIEAINDTANRQLSAINQTATSQIKAINDTGQAQSEALKEQGDGLKYDLAVKEKHTISLSTGTYSDLINVTEYDAIQVNSISCGGTDTISEDLKLEVVKFKNGEQVGDEFLEKYNAIADLTGCDSIKLLVVYQGESSDVATVWYTLIVWDAKKEIERYVERVEDAVLIKPTESGTEINLNDSSDMNIQELHLFGKSEQKTTKGIQLLNLKDAKGGTGDGVTYTPNGDGSFKKTGTATGQIGNIWLKGGYYSDWENRTPIITLEVGKSYYIKDCAIFQGKTIILSSESGQVINVTEEKYPGGIKITGIRNTGFTLNKTYNEVIYPIVAESSTAVEWEEYTGGQPSPSPDYPQAIESVENPKLSISGKNILKQSVPTVSFDKNTKITKLEESENKIKIKINEVGEYIYISIPLKNIIKEIKANTTYTIVFNNATQIKNCFWGSGNAIIKLTNSAYCKENKVVLKTLSELPNNPKQYYIYIGIYNKKGNIAGFDDIAVFEGDYSNVNINSIEPYKPLQTATLNYELNGIGDVKDELIVRTDGTGQLIQRLAKKIMDGSNIDASASGQQEGSYLVNIETVSDMLTGNYNVGLSTICSNKRSGKEKNTIRFGANNKNVYLYLDESFAGKTPTELRKYFVENPFTIVYPLEKPIVTNLSAEEVQKILNLHTNKPNTTIWNDQDAEMQVTYVADTKNYIDNKLAKIQALTLEGGN